MGPPAPAGSRHGSGRKRPPARHESLPSCCGRPCSRRPPCTACPHRPPRARGGRTRRRRAVKRNASLRQREHREGAAELRVVPKLLVPTDGPRPIRSLLESGRHADAGPAADAREDAEVLLALVLVREDVADDPGRRLELVELLVHVVRIDALDVTLERAVAGEISRGDERAAPHRELLGLALDDLAL